HHVAADVSRISLLLRPTSRANASLTSTIAPSASNSTTPSTTASTMLCHGSSLEGIHVPHAQPYRPNRACTKPGIRGIIRKVRAVREVSSSAGSLRSPVHDDERVPLHHVPAKTLALGICDPRLGKACDELERSAHCSSETRPILGDPARISWRAASTSPIGLVIAPSR